MAEAQTLSAEYSEQVMPNTILELTAAVFGIFGNSLVILMYTKYVKDNSRSRYFIPVLAVVDLTGTVSNVTEFYLENTRRYIYPSVFLCKTMHFLITFTGECSALVILAIAVQRYLIICRPFGKQMSQKVCRITILIILNYFLICAGYASPILKFFGLYKPRQVNATSNLTLCTTHDGTDMSNSVIISYLGIVLFFSFVNIFIVSILYIPVIKTIYGRFTPGRRHRPDVNINIASKETQIWHINSRDSVQINEESNDDSKKGENPGQKARKNISVMFLVIIIVYVVSYLTSLVTRIHNFASTEEIKGYKINIYVLCIRFQLLNHIANPYIYWIFDIKFRNELRRFCCRNIFRK